MNPILSAGAWLHRLESLYLRRRAAATVPLQTLAELLRQARPEPARCAALCIDLGLVNRARQTLGESGTTPTLADALQLAWLEGDFTRFDRLARDPASPTALSQAPQRLQNRALSVMAARSPSTALAFIEAMPRRPACAPAVALRAQAPDSARAWRRDWRWRLHADYLLLDANQADSATQRLEGLNRYLARHGLSPLRLIDPTRPLGVTNLVAARATASAPAAAVSVVIAAHDNERHIGAAIGSLLGQTRPPAEIVVVDDASRDGTIAAVSRIAAAHARIRLIRLAVNRGAYFARNVGLAAAAQPFVAFHDADDFAHPQRLERAMAPLLDDSQLHATTSRCVRLSDDGVFGEARVWPLTRWNPITMVLRREPTLARVGYFEDTRFGADSEFAARLRTVLGERHHRLLAQPLALFGQRAGSLTTGGTAGFDEQARSAPRIAYQQAWTERHLDSLLNGTSLYLGQSEDVATALSDARVPTR